MYYKVTNSKQIGILHDKNSNKPLVSNLRLVLIFQCKDKDEIHALKIEEQTRIVLLFTQPSLVKTLPF